MDIKEILIPIEPPIGVQKIDTESLPLSAMPVMATVFCGSAFAGAPLEKDTESWFLKVPSRAETHWDTYNDWWLLVRYVDQDEPVYYGPTFDEIDDTDDGQPVDLGLPSGTKWMKSNIGATKPSDFGLFFQWGDTQGYSGVGEHQFNQNDYKWITNCHITKYDKTDGKLVLDNEDDPVYAATSGQYKSPTKDQLQELKDNTEYRWLHLANGVNGMKFWKKGTEEPTDGNSYIFIPAAGDCFNGSHNNVGSDCYVWSTSLHNLDIGRAWCMDFYAATSYENSYFRYLGHSARGVVA